MLIKGKYKSLNFENHILNITWSLHYDPVVKWIVHK